jgi:L-seryl-tRNA(Ser) seleniumtransferase
MERRELPSVDRLLRSPEVAALPREGAVAAVRETLAQAREEIAAGHDPGDLVQRVVEAAAARNEPRLRHVVNATGVVLHTNLGRAPIAEEALEHVRRTARAYSNLEYDLGDGRRGSRHDHLAAVLRRLTGAEDALVVNNNAAALLLAVSALADGREVVVSRGELIEIGDGFRIHEVLERSRARLVEVGTTNRTRAADYEAAVGEGTALLLRVHQSNFRTVGFTERPELKELVALARRHGLPLLDDLGSGSLAPLADEPLVPESIAGGADLATFSGDKLLGGPQAGIVCGRAELIGRLRRHPLQRALRPDKLTLAALEGTLLLYLDPERAQREIPVLRMLNEDTEVIRSRAERLAAAAGGEVVETVARVGGGALPLLELPSAACALEGDLSAPLRAAPTPVVALVREGRTLLDCRTIADEEVAAVAAAVESCRAS